jgi:hypothetical protein
MPSTISRRGFVVSIAMLLTSRMSWSAGAVPPLLDHVILGCNDLDRGIAFVKEHTGVSALPSGVHTGRGTRNALLTLGERSYLEILAPDPAQSVQSPELARLAAMSEPRLFGWAAHPGSIEQLAQRLKKHNILFYGPTDGSRKRPNGQLLRWRTVVLKDDLGGLLPFFIEWSAESLHPSADAPQGCRLATMGVRGPEPATLQKIFHDLGIEMTVEPAQKPQLNAQIIGRTGTMNLVS